MYACEYMFVWLYMYIKVHINQKYTSLSGGHKLGKGFMWKKLFLSFSSEISFLLTQESDSILRWENLGFFTQEYDSQNSGIDLLNLLESFQSLWRYIHLLCPVFSFSNASGQDDWEEGVRVPVNREEWRVKTGLFRLGHEKWTSDVKHSSHGRNLNAHPEMNGWRRCDIHTKWNTTQP